MTPRAFLALAIQCVLAPLACAAGGDVLMYHNDAASTGQYLTEPLLSATNVNSTNFGKVYKYNVDGQVYAQPLYKSGLAITTGSYQGTRNVVFVATENDSLYAFDADDSAGSGPLWQDSFINAANGVTTVPSADVSTNDLSPRIGITSTPVISASTNTIFVCAKTMEIISSSTNFIFRLHAINMSNGQEQPGSPVVIADTISNDLSTYTFVSGPAVPGAGAGSVGGQVTFNALRQHQRAALALVNGVVYLAFASHGDNAPYHGWVLGYNATTYQLVAAWNADPGGNDSGIWQSGGALASDTTGNLYLMTGNGTFTQPTYNPATATYVNGNYGDSFVRLAVDSVYSSSTNQNGNGWGLKVVSYFTPYNQSSLSGADKDLGSGAPMLLPNSVGSGAHPHLIVGAGKQGTLYMADRDSMGGYNSVSDPVLEEEISAFAGCFSTPAYFNGVIYLTPANNSDAGLAFPISSGSFSPATAATPDTYGFPGASPCISGAGAADPNAIVWCLDGGNGSGQLRAYLASNFSDELYTSAQAANSRDATGGTCKFALPTIANTRVYVPATSSLIVYGLFNSQATVPPAAPGNLIAAALDENTVWLSWAANSSNQGGYYIEQSTDGASFTQIAATGSSSLSYPVTALTSGSTYYFRVRAYNGSGDSSYSNVASATTFTWSPNVDFASGFSTSGSSMDFNTNGAGSIPPNTPQLQMVTGADYEAHSAWVSTLENITGFTTQFDFQVGGTEPLADGIAFVIQRSGTSALGQPGGDLGYGGISEGVAFYFDVYNGSFTGLYGSGTNIDVNAAAGINFHNGDMMRVTLSYNGATMAESIEDLATNALFTTAYSVNIPATVGGTTGYVGFTGGTGGDNSIQDIYHWIFTSIPNAPANLVATPNSDKQATLTWTNNSGGDASYEIDRANDNFFTVNAVALSGPASTTGTGVYIDAALAGDTGYYYRVRALNSAGASAYTGTAAILTYCSAPASPAAIGGNGNVSMAWSPSGGASSYNLYRALASGGEGSTPYQSGIGSASYTDNSATNGTAYYYTVRAVNPTGAGPQSSEFSATPSASETFEQWQLAEFGSVPAAESAAAADTANPAGDGISNLMKYALDLNPYVQGSSGLPAGSVMAIGGSNYLTLTFLRPHPAPGDITYNVETTNSLPGGSWTPSVVVAGYPVNNGNGTETMRERSASPASSPSQFIRLRVTGP